MKLRYLILVVLLALLTVEADAQRRRGGTGRHYRDIFPGHPQYSLGHWYFAPGLTYMLPSFNPSSRKLIENDSVNYTADIDPSGGLWFALEMGRYHFFKNPGFFRYHDYGLSYKGFRGKETYNAEFTRLDTVMAAGSGTNSFQDHFVSANYNLNQVIEFTDFHFLQNTFGANVDFAFNRTRNQEMNVEGVDLSDNRQFTGQLHYKLGLGWKPNNRMLVILGLETPIVTFYPITDDPLHVTYFNSKYRPFILSLRFMPLEPFREKNCVPVRTRDGARLPTDMMR